MTTSLLNRRSLACIFGALSLSASIAAAQDNGAPTANISAVSYQGTLCPKDTVKLAGQLGSYMISLFGPEEQPGLLSSDCTVSFTVDVPSGYRFTNAIVDVQGKTSIDEPAVRTAFSTETWFEGSTEVSKVDGKHFDWIFQVFDEVKVSSPCSTGKPVKVNVKVKALSSSLPQDEVDNFDINIIHLSLEKAKWSKCTAGR